MKIGVFDSGLGGLIVARSLMQALPQYDFVYLGDTARVPYGNRSQEVIFSFTQQAVAYLLAHDCQLVILACNTASAEALRRIQQEYLPKHFPDRRVLGVLIPAAEEAVATTKTKRVGILATQGTVQSGTFVAEIHKLDAEIEVFQEAAPLLVPLIENDTLQYAEPILHDYLEPLLEKEIDTLVLGCTHYPLLKDMIRSMVGSHIQVVSQDEFLAEKLQNYLSRHSEIESKLSRHATQQFLVTDLSSSTEAVARRLFGKNIDFKKVSLGK